MWSEISPDSWWKLFMGGTNCQVKRTFPQLGIHFIINHHLRTSTALWGWEEGSVFHFIPKLGEFLRLSGSLSEAVGWIRPSMEIFLGLALNKKGAQWSMSCDPLVPQTESCRLPLQMGLQGTHTNWPAEPPSHTIPSLLSQQLLYRTTLQHH